MALSLIHIYPDTDPMFKQAVEVVIDAGQASTSLLQRRCKLGYALSLMHIYSSLVDKFIRPAKQLFRRRTRALP